MALFCAVSTPAFGDIFECQEASGRKWFTNVKSEAEANGCKQLHVAVPISEANRKIAEENRRRKAAAAEARLMAERRARDAAQIGMTLKEALAAGWGRPDRISK